MKKIILIPDSSKGTMSSAEICGIMERAIRNHFPAAEVLSIPVADGGEGSVDCFLQAMSGDRVPVKVKGPYFEDMESFYGRLPDGAAVIEMAACAGLPLVGENKAAEKTTTYGVGQLIRHAVEQGAKKLIVGLGGSATNDGGTGAAAALGVRFIDGDGKDFVPTGATLKDIVRIDMSGLLPVLADVEIITMCDIDNPLCGENGAAHVFGPQKGATPETVRMLDQGLYHLGGVILSDLGMEIRELPGAGAAGGMGGGMAAFFRSRLQMGIEAVLDTVGYDRLLDGADLVITGEGRLDTQSLRGKVVVGVARRTRGRGVPVVAVVGDIGDNVERAYDEGLCGIFSTNRVAAPFDRGRAASDLYLTADNLMRYSRRMLDK